MWCNWSTRLISVTPKSNYACCPSVHTYANLKQISQLHFGLRTGRVDQWWLLYCNFLPRAKYLSFPVLDTNCMMISLSLSTSLANGSLMLHLSSRLMLVSSISQFRRAYINQDRLDNHITGVFNDPLGQTHSYASSDHYFISEFYCFAESGTDGWTHDLYENSDHYRPWCGSTKWINIMNNKKKYFSPRSNSDFWFSQLLVECWVLSRVFWYVLMRIRGPLTRLTTNRCQAGWYFEEVSIEHSHFCISSGLP